MERSRSERRLGALVANEDRGAIGALGASEGRRAAWGQEAIEGRGAAGGREASRRYTMDTPPPATGTDGGGAQ